VLPPGKLVAPHTVVAIGYNSLWQKDREDYDKWAAKFDREANAILDLVRSRGAQHIAWVTLREASQEAIITAQQIDQNNRFGFYLYYVNERLRLLAEANDDLILADWAAVSRGPGVTYDLIHLNPTGARLMVKTIAGAYGL
jgi:lysophospholipase L1-like esterase